MYTDVICMCYIYGSVMYMLTVYGYVMYMEGEGGGGREEGGGRDAFKTSTHTQWSGGKKVGVSGGAMA